MTVKAQNKEKVGLETKLRSLPTGSGVYQFKDKTGKIIYVGKAKNLRNRVRQYFNARTAGPRIDRMISLISDVEIINTDSEVESLILEMNLIKELKPRYNVNLKDDKSYPYIVITNEPYPRVFPTRKRRNDGSRYFGPYTDVGTMRYSLKMLRDIFMIRNCSLNITQQAIDQKKFKICLEYHIHKCEGPCEGLVSEQHYNEMIDEVEKVLNGKTSSLIRELKAKMEKAARSENFEEAAMLRNKIQSLEVYAEKQKVVFEDLMDRDVFGFVKEENEGCAMVLNIRDGKVIGKRHFYLDSLEDKSDSEILESVLFRYYSENNYIPDEIDLQSELADKNAIEGWFMKKSGKKIEYVFPKRGEKLKLISMVKTNAQYMLDELKLQRLKREFIPHSITALKRDLRLSKLPRRIECFDISNIQGTDTVASMVVFYDGKPKKSEYRKFKILSAMNEAGRPDDFASMREVIYRRYVKNAEEIIEKTYSDSGNGSASSSNPFPIGKGKRDITPLPDLIVIDGGKGQLSSAVTVLNGIGIKEQNIIGLAKKLEEVFMPGISEAQSIPKTSSGLKLLQRVRDEAHRFAITVHRSLRDKRTLTSELEEIKGIGKKTAQKLLTEFGSVEKIKVLMRNNYEEFENKAGKKSAERIKKWFEGK
jgi:excinuclease ABC subunit C